MPHRSMQGLQLAPRSAILPCFQWIDFDRNGANRWDSMRYPRPLLDQTIKNGDQRGSKKVLQGKVALVFGGSRGIGEAIVRRLAVDGASVALTYVTSAERAADIAHAVKLKGLRRFRYEPTVLTRKP